MSNQIMDKERKGQLQEFRLMVAERIRDRLKTNKMKNDDLARATGLSINTINSITCGRQNANLMDLVSVSDSLDCPLDFLAKGKLLYEVDICPDMMEVLKKSDYGTQRRMALGLKAMFL